MHRRSFLSTVATVSVGSVAMATTASGEAPARSGSKRGDWFDPSRVWHFFDLWHLDHCNGIRLVQGQPEWQSDATFVEPHIGNLSAWPTVYRDQRSGRWRMLYSANWKPYSLMLAESDDGRTWRPLPQPEIRPAGGKLADHHLFTLPGGSGGAVYIDPVAEDGFPFKVFVHQQGEQVAERAVKDPRHRWHNIAQREGSKRYFGEEFMLASRDGLHWEERRDLCWANRDWHPEPPIFGFYHSESQHHCMTVRPGWGDRRQCLQSTADFRTWSGPQLLMQPDAADKELIEIYGMPVFRYGDGYVGLPWVFHCSSSEATRGFNRFVGSIDCQLASSHDGRRFVRSLREAFIPTNELGEHGGGAIQPSSMIETDDEVRIYSAASKVLHGQGNDARQRGLQSASILLHTLRKDGLMFLRPEGDWGRLISKPLVLLEPSLTMNAAAPLGEIWCQFTDLESRPIEGFTFDDFEPFLSDDAIKAPLLWKSPLEMLVGRIVRLELRLRHAQVCAFHGHFHFIDAQDKWMIEDGQPIVV